MLPGLLSLYPPGDKGEWGVPQGIPALVRTELPPLSAVARWTRWREEGDALPPTLGPKHPQVPPQPHQNTIPWFPHSPAGHPPPTLLEDS